MLLDLCSPTDRRLKWLKTVLESYPYPSYYPGIFERIESDNVFRDNKDLTKLMFISLFGLSEIAEASLHHPDKLNDKWNSKTALSLAVEADDYKIVRSSMCLLFAFIHQRAVSLISYSNSDDPNYKLKTCQNFG